jgi:hypothetical protein
MLPQGSSTPAIQRFPTMDLSVQNCGGKLRLVWDWRGIQAATPV